MRHSRAGFTLLEILVALAVLGFLMLGLSQGLRFGLAAWDSQARLLGRGGDLDIADRTLRRIVTQIVPTDDPQNPALRGTAHGFEAVTELPVTAALPTRQASVALGVDRTGRLVLRWTPYLHARRFGPPPPPEESELLRNLARIELGYWSAAAGGGWLSGWARPEPPDLVRIRLVFARGDARRWPEIVVAPMRERTEE
ncbi:PulJ/GspJ family protein [Dankookia sp. P2]|uniref:PulJ/GspJ family protein n=1 Tax=Dankookia sp. P2 TaxID=3423955 RepID=UPI003D67B825